MLVFADQRAFASDEERFVRCVFCGKELVVLPDDRRGNCCFDCLPLLGPEAAPCPECDYLIPGERRTIGCPACGWFPQVV